MGLGPRGSPFAELASSSQGAPPNGVARKIPASNYKGKKNRWLRCKKYPRGLVAGGERRAQLSGGWAFGLIQEFADRAGEEQAAAFAAASRA